jgi:hypothetical protein
MPRDLRYVPCPAAHVTHNRECRLDRESERGEAQTLPLLLRAFLA